MKLFLIILLLSANALAFSKKRAPEPSPTPSPTPVVEPIPTPDAVTHNITIKCDNTCTDKERADVPLIEARIYEIMKTDCFSDAFTDLKKRSKLVQTNNLTREQVVEMLRTKGAHMTLSYYTKTLSNVVGYTYPGVPVIYANRKFHNDYGICTKASNIGHEASHNMGFDHDYEATAQRPYSVPYTINFAFGLCCKD